MIEKRNKLEYNLHTRWHVEVLKDENLFKFICICEKLWFEISKRYFKYFYLFFINSQPI